MNVSTRMFHRPLFLICCLAAVFAPARCPAADSTGEPSRPTEAERQKDVEAADRLDIRHARGTAADSSAMFVTPPRDLKGLFTVASTPPAIEFAPIRELLPEYFPDENFGQWSHWGEITRGGKGKVYLVCADHRAKNAHIFITEYDPAAHDQRIVVDVGRVCGWKENQYVHGYMNGKPRLLEDGTLVLATWNGNHILPEYLEHGYVEGGWVLTYNVNTGVAESHGIPFYGDSWSSWAVDRETGVLMAIGTAGNFMAYDVRSRRLLYGGYPPDGIKWSGRGTLLDDRTGMLYGTDGSSDTFEYVSYDPRTNVFRRMGIFPPPNPRTGKTSALRAYTEIPSAEGVFHCIDGSGTIYAFDPEARTTVVLGLTWGDEGVYTASVVRSPGGEYLYYLPGALGQTMHMGLPVVQYHIPTGTRKVIAFLQPFYHDTYGYVIQGSYGVDLSADGGTLFIQTNGSFSGDLYSPLTTNPALFAVHIPAGERVE